MTPITRRDPDTGMIQKWQTTANGGRWVDDQRSYNIDALTASDTDSPSSMMAQSAIGMALAAQPNPSADSTSAEDRVRGFNRRLLWPMSLVVVLALVASMAYAMAVDTQLPWMLDRILVFLLILGGMGFWVWTVANNQEYRHSQAGIQLKKIDVADRIHARQQQHELQQRRDQLTALLQLEDKDQVDG